MTAMCVCAWLQRLEELSVTSSRLEHDIKLLRSTSYHNTAGQPGPRHAVARQPYQYQQQQLITKVC